jgi:Tfp pilus assembly PilM family ATPase
MSAKSFLSIDWDVRTLRMVHARMKRREVTIDQVLSASLPSDLRTNDAESLGAFIGQAVSEAGFTTKWALVDIPRDQVNFYVLNLPNASVSDLAGMVAFQIPKELPFAVERAVVDFAVAEATDGETCDVLVAAVRVEVLEFYRKVFEVAGLKLMRVGLRPNANQFAVNAMLATTPYDETLFVDVGPRTTEIDMFRGGHLVFSRAADVPIPSEFDGPTVVEDSVADVPETSGLSLVTGAGALGKTLDSVVSELMIEVTRSIEAYRVTHPGAPIGHAVVGGSCDIEEALATAIQDQYKITAQPYNPASCFGWDADRGAAAGAFAATLGLALSQAEEVQFHFNFLQPKRQTSQAERRIKKAPFAIAATLMLVVAGGGFYVKSIKPQFVMRDQLRGQLADLESVLERQQDFKAMVGAIEEYEKDQVVWIDTLRDLVDILPDREKLVLSDIDLSQKGKRIKLPYRAKESGIGTEAAESLSKYTAEDEKTLLYDAKLGATSVKTKLAYPHTGSLIVEVVHRRKLPSEGGRTHGGDKTAGGDRSGDTKRSETK